MTEFMRSTDAFTWAMESDPRLRSTVIIPDFDVFHECLIAGFDEVLAIAG